MAATVIRRYVLVPVVVTTPTKPRFDGPKRPVRSVSRVELDWARKQLAKRQFKVAAFSTKQASTLATQAAKFLRALDPDTEITGFVANESIPWGPIWRNGGSLFLHPSSGASSVCVSMDGKGAQVRWTQLAFRADELS